MNKKSYLRSEKCKYLVTSYSLQSLKIIQFPSNSNSSPMEFGTNQRQRRNGNLKLNFIIGYEKIITRIPIKGRVVLSFYVCIHIMYMQCIITFFYY